MKLITLNIWGGHLELKSALLDFIARHRDIDIFCLQELYHKAPHKTSDEEREISLNIFSEIQDLLPHHQAFFRPVVQNIYGIGMLVKNTLDVLSEGEVIIHENPDYRGLGPLHQRNLQWLECRVQEKIYSIINVHGLWNGQGKTDTPDRLKQSQRIRDFVETLNTPKVICGDFNLRPDTESLKIIEQGMVNWVKRSNIKSTRTSFYTKEEKFADYIFTSPEIQVSHFGVMPDEVSDHAALLIDFE